MTVNAIAVVPRVHADDQERIGLALYPAASLLNHSCIPPTSFSGLHLACRHSLQRAAARGLPIPRHYMAGLRRVVVRVLVCTNADAASRCGTCDLFASK